MAQHRLARTLQDHTFDLIVVGAGLNGAGIARDAALRGLQVLVVEQEDIGAATSAWNSRLIHGGLRYLEHGEIGLVRESLREREILLRTAPHRVAPLALMVPVYRHSRRGLGLIRMGMAAYDLLSYDKSLPNHRIYNLSQTRAAEPGLAGEGLRGAALYYDAQVAYPERLVLDNLLEAQEHGACVLTHTRADRILRDTDTGSACGVALSDRLGGARSNAYAPAVINVTGPWVDRLLGRSLSQPKRRIGGTKGVHVFVRPFPGAPRRGVYAEAPQDGRPYFTLPWNGGYLIGTTDTRFAGNPAEARAEPEDIDYLLAATNRLIPAANLRPSDVCFSYAGVRPLPHTAADAPGAITRRHLIVSHAPEATGLWSVIGGKLTTYRHLAEQAIDRMAQEQGWKLPACSTHRRPLPGAWGDDGGREQASLREAGASAGLPAATVERLLQVYGSRAAALIERAQNDRTLAAPISPATGAIAAEILHAFEAEGAQTLADALLRRTLIALGPEAGLDALHAAAAVGRSHLGWDEQRVQEETTTCERLLKDILQPAGGA